MESNRHVSRLYSLKPLALATPYVESLSGYNARLANAHCVTAGTLIAKEIAPLLGKDYISKASAQGGSMFYYSSAALNGAGKLAEDFITALEQLTLRADLRFTSMLTWKEVIPMRDMFHRRRVWCPLCYEEWLNNDETIYEPLIWCLKVIKMCPKHNIKLSFSCPHQDCGQENLIFNRKSRPGYCSKCGGWLGTSVYPKIISQEIFSAEELDWQKFVSLQVGEILSLAPSLLYSPLRGRVQAGIISLIDQLTGGNIARFAELIRRPKVTVWDWSTGKSLPTLEALIRICYCSGVSLVDLLTNDNFVARPRTDTMDQSFKIKDILRSKTSEISLIEMKIELEKALRYEQTPPPSVTEMARRLGHDRRVLRHHFPALCKQISKQFLEYKHNQKLNRIWNNHVKVRAAIDKLLLSGVYPSRRKVEKYVCKKAILREQDVQKVWKNELNRTY